VCVCVYENKPFDILFYYNFVGLNFYVFKAPEIVSEEEACNQINVDTICLHFDNIGSNVCPSLFPTIGFLEKFELFIRKLQTTKIFNCSRY
jgi:hypothetical protein